MTRQIRGQTGGATPANALPSLLTIAEESLTVAHLATTDLWCADPAASIEVVAGQMRSFGYDVAPLKEEVPLNYVALADLADATGKVADVAKPIDISLLVTAEFSLVDAIRALATAPYFFVLKSNRLAGLVTWSDLQRPAVSMVLFSLILASETAMNSLIVAVYGETWESQLSDGRRRYVGRIFDSRKRHNTEISMLECLMLEDRLELIAKKRQLWTSLGYGSRLAFNS